MIFRSIAGLYSHSNITLLTCFFQTQFLLAALLASMAVQPETVTRPPGVSVTVDTSWGGLEDFVMVGQFKKQQIPAPSILLIGVHSYPYHLVHPSSCLHSPLPLSFCSNLLSPLFLHLRFLLPFSPILLLSPFSFNSLSSPMPPRPQILTSAHRGTLDVSKDASIKLVPTSVTAFLDTRERMQHTVVS